MRRRFCNGIDRQDELDRLFGKDCRLGLICNPTMVTCDYESGVEFLAKRYRVAALFGPEHGVNGDRPPGAAVADGVNAVLGIPEYSLYGGSGECGPAAERLAKIDILVFDIQDIGSRYYTYISTLSDAMKACAAAGKRFVVLDRPNPLGGEIVEGTLLRREYSSFVGRYPLPVRHGLTVGEYAGMVNDRYGIGCELNVVPMAGWRRGMTAWEEDCSWLNPSPNMPSADCALLYNGSCLLEGTNISEGRGTTRPYEVIGAPFLPHREIAAKFNHEGVQGVRARSCYFTPWSGKYAGELCRGLQLQITDRKAVNGFEAGLRLLDKIRQCTEEFEVMDAEHFDHLFGDDKLRLNREGVDSICERGRRESAEFREGSEKYWLYGA